MAKTLVLALFVGSFVLHAASLASANDPSKTPAAPQVFVYSEKLTAKDKLSFGPGTEQKDTIPIKGETTLIYVDLEPDARFSHATKCILISADGVRVIDGDWWLILNGKPLFRNGTGDPVGCLVDFDVK